MAHFITEVWGHSYLSTESALLSASVGHGSSLLFFIQMNHVIRIGFLCALVLTGCTPTDRRLALAEKQLTTDPGEALTILKEIPTQGMGRRNRARHALLTSLAMDKNYIDTADDSLAQIAVSYYDRHGSVRGRMLAHYSLGRVRKNGGRNVEAILSFQQAEMLARECGDAHYLGLSSRNEGEIHGLSHNYILQKQCYEKSLEAFRTEGNALYADYSQLSLARTLGILGETKRSDSLLRAVLRNGSCPDLETEAWRTLASNHAAGVHPNPDSILYCYGCCLERPGTRLTAAEETERALAYALLNRADSVRTILARARSMASTEDEATLAYNRARIHALSGEDTGLDFARMNREWSRIFYRDICASVSAFTGEYYRMEALQQRYKTSAERMKSAFGLFLLALAALSTYLGYRRERMIQAATFTTASLLFRQQDQVLTQLIPERIQLLNRLAEMYNDLDESDSGLLSRKDKDRSQVILSFKEELNRLREDDALWEKLETVLDREKDGVPSLLRTHFPKLKEDEYHRLLLLYAGVTAETAGIITNQNVPGTVRQQKHRFLKRVRGASLPDRDRKALLDNMP